MRESHVHGFRDGMLLVAASTPGRGLDADVIRSVPLADLAFAETCEQDDSAEDEEPSEHSGWTASWQDD